MDNIIFIGMPASGKSTIGVVTAKRLGYGFIDPDILIQEQEGRLLHQIIEQDGIDKFRSIEDRVNAEINADRCVISPGGSIIYCENAMAHYKEIGRIVYLEVSYKTIEERIGDPHKRGVTLSKGQSLKPLYDERRIYFERYADVTVSEDGLTLAETIDKVLESIE